MDGMIFRRRAMASLAARSQSKYIQFEDPVVKAICIANWSSDGIGLTMEDAAAVTEIGNAFYQNTEIEYFNEFEYFTGVTFLVNSNQAATLKHSFYGCTNLKEIRLPSSLTTIYDGTESYKNGAFYGCESLVSFGDMSHLVRIGRYAFRGCTSFVQDIDLPNAEGTLGELAFYQTAIKKVVNLGKITILSGLNTASINSPQGPFARCESLVEARLPATLTEIREGAFGFCTALTTLIIDATTPPTLDANAWYGGSSTFLIYVPDASLEAYKTATNWSTYADRIHPLSEIEGNNGVTLYDRLYGDGTAYIETDYYLKGNERIESAAQVVFIDINSRYLWGANDGSHRTSMCTGGNSSSKRMQYVMYYGSASYLAFNYLTTSEYPSATFFISPSQYGLGSITKSLNGSRIGIIAPFCIFSGDENTYRFKGWIGSVIITDTDTSEVLAKFTPASYNGEAGMYDEVSGKFYGNAASSGAFYVENE